jgi:hypothetical protein
MLYQTIIIRQLKIIVLFWGAVIFWTPGVEAGWLIDHGNMPLSMDKIRATTATQISTIAHDTPTLPMLTNSRLTFLIRSTAWHVMITFWRISIRDYTVPRKL